MVLYQSIDMVSTQWQHARSTHTLSLKRHKLTTTTTVFPSSMWIRAIGVRIFQKSQASQHQRWIHNLVTSKL